MRFNIALSFVVALVAGGSFAAKPQETFNNNRERILAGDCYKTGGYYFGVGIGIVRSARSASDNFAKEKAVQDAKSNLICRKAVEGVVWPKSLDKHSIAVLSQLAYKYVTVQASVSEIEVISVEKTDAVAYTAVVAVSEENLTTVPRASFDEVKLIPLNPHRLKISFKKHPKELYDFYLTQKKLPDELSGINFVDWNAEQLDLFCGTPKPSVTTNAVIEKVEEEMLGARHSEPETQNGAAKDKGFIVNINETIEF